ELLEIIGDDDSPQVSGWLKKRPFEVRPVEGSLHAPGGADPSLWEQHSWIRTSAPFGSDRVLNAAALAYASDFNLLEPVLRRQMLTRRTPGLRVASLDHAMWSHRPVRVDASILYAQAAPAAQGGRALGYGRTVAAACTLPATVAQDGMARVKE